MDAQKTAPSSTGYSSKGLKPARGSIKGKHHYTEFLHKLGRANTYIDEHGWPEKPYPNEEAERVGK
jgi:hypothetical protein